VTGGAAARRQRGGAARAGVPAPGRPVALGRRAVRARRPGGGGRGLLRRPAAAAAGKLPDAAGARAQARARRPARRPRRRLAVRGPPAGRGRRSGAVPGLAGGGAAARAGRALAAGAGGAAVGRGRALPGRPPLPERVGLRAAAAWLGSFSAAPTLLSLHAAHDRCQLCVRRMLAKALTVTAPPATRTLHSSAPAGQRETNSARAQAGDRVHAATAWSAGRRGDAGGHTCPPPTCSSAACRGCELLQPAEAPSLLPPSGTLAAEAAAQQAAGRLLLAEAGVQLELGLPLLVGRLARLQLLLTLHAPRALSAAAAPAEAARKPSGPGRSVHSSAAHLVWKVLGVLDHTQASQSARDAVRPQAGRCVHRARPSISVSHTCGMEGCSAGALGSLLASVRRAGRSACGSFRGT